MKRIELNRNNIIKKIDEGMESVIYIYKDGSNICCIKLLKKYIELPTQKIEIPEETFENKRKKIEIINNDPLFSDEVRPISLVYENGMFLGYTMELENYKTAEVFDSRKKKIEILRKYKEKIEKFNEHGIYIGDISENNIFITENGIKLCDLDNIRIGNLDFDIKNCFQKEYLRKYKDIENIDKYTFNLFTIGYLSKIVSVFIDSYLKEGKLPKPINSKRNLELIKDKNYTEDYFIDNLKKEYILKK